MIFLEKLLAVDHEDLKAFLRDVLLKSMVDSIPLVERQEPLDS